MLLHHCLLLFLRRRFWGGRCLFEVDEVLATSFDQDHVESSVRHHYALRDEVVKKADLGPELPVLELAHDVDEHALEVVGVDEELVFREVGARVESL